MAEEFTDRYKLQRLTRDELSANSFKYTNADRVTIDALLYQGAEGHHHNGGTATDLDPSVGPTLQLETYTGTIPPGTRIYYKFTFIDVNGIESAASPESWIDTPAGISSPAAPSLSFSVIGGSLPPGPYYYQISAYSTFNNRETLVGNASYISVPYSTATNTITLVLPALPSGATGFNVYRKSPASIGYRYLTSIEMISATPPTTYVDTGAIAETQTRLIPVSNTTTVQNAITVSIPGATPTIEAGASWRIYRSYSAADYSDSLLVTIPPAATPIYSYLDVGEQTSSGQPPVAGTAIGSPEKVDLTNGAEVQGLLPLAMVTSSALNYASLSSNQAITNDTDLTGLTKQVSVGEDRLIRITGSATVSVDDSGGQWIGTVQEGATVLGRWGEFKASAAGQVVRFEGSVVLNGPSVGSHTYKLTLHRLSGTGDADVIAASNNPAWILIEDIGSSI